MLAGSYRIIETPHSLCLMPDPKNQQVVAIVCLVFGVLPWALLLLRPSLQFQLDDLAVYGGLSLLCLCAAVYQKVCRTEVYFDLQARHVALRRICLRRGRVLAVLPLDHLKAVQVTKIIGLDTVGVLAELRLIRSDGNVWARLMVQSAYQAIKLRQVVLSWLDRAPRQ